jgi:hypothetical protein
MGTVLIVNKERLSSTMISEAPTGGMSAGNMRNNLIKNSKKTLTEAARMS